MGGGDNKIDKKVKRTKWWKWWWPVWWTEFSPLLHWWCCDKSLYVKGVIAIASAAELKWADSLGSLWLEIQPSIVHPPLLQAHTPNTQTHTQFFLPLHPSHSFFSPFFSHSPQTHTQILTHTVFIFFCVCIYFFFFI